LTLLRRALPRRAFLKISLGASGALGLYGMARFLSREEPSSAPQHVVAGYPAEYPVGAVTPIPEARAVLIHDENGFYALSASCPHLGCTLGTDVSPLECPCHGSRFNEQGLVIHGPASRPLVALELSLTSDGRILVDCNSPAPIDQRLPAGA
jgi:Rieske Fe-S protein